MLLLSTINRADVELSRGGPRCYLRFLIGGQLTKPIVLQLEHVSNPILSAQLILFFSTKFYEGNAVIKTGSGESISCKSSRSQTDESKDEIMADVFTVVRERRGSVRFPIKELRPNRAYCFKNLQIILVDRPNHHRFTSVFAHIVSGIEICDCIRKLNTAIVKVTVAETGILP